MITLLTRKELLASKSIIASEIAQIQKSFYSEELLQDYKDKNEEHLYWDMYDYCINDVIDVEHNEKILTLNHSTLSTFTKKLARKLDELFSTIGATEFYVISFIKRDFFGNRENEYNPLVKAYQKLEKIVGKNSYNEAFSLDRASLFDMLEVLFWISRCDPSVSDYIYLFDKDEQVKMFICKYGNIHLQELGAEKLSDSLINSLGWEIIEGYESDNFSNGRKPAGSFYRK